MVLEDDALLLEDAITVISQEVPEILRREEGTRIHLELTAHFPLSAFVATPDALECDKQGAWVKIPLLANTTCAYIVGRDLLESMYSTLLVHPEYRQLGADWMINRIGASLEDGACLTWTRGRGPYSNQSLTTSTSSIT
ncbi:MAG: hypothetical protein GC156_11730 [Actinomycetales bacterium]|nr:hypothetical protein [Actinomycetales bacterium]